MKTPKPCPFCGAAFRNLTAAGAVKVLKHAADCHMLVDLYRREHCFWERNDPALKRWNVRKPQQPKGQRR